MKSYFTFDVTPWFVVSGLDGSGKTTLVNNLENYFTSCGMRVKRDRLPHDPYLVKKLLDESTDEYTDRMLFALDNRIFGEHLSKWRASKEYDVILTQRGYLDSFVHGAVQGFDYNFIARMNRIGDLPKCQVIIHLVAKAEIAFNRIKDDPEADKFEYIEYIRRQEEETRRGYHECMYGNADLSHFHDGVHIYVDTSSMTTDETFEYVLERLKKNGVI